MEKYTRKSKCENCRRDFSYSTKCNNFIKKHCSPECATSSKYRYFNSVFINTKRKPKMFINKINPETLWKHALNVENLENSE